MAEKFATVDEYIASFPDDVRAILEQIRALLHAVVPGSGETISYDIPTVTLGGKSLVYFAGWKHHVSVYPLPAGDPEFERELAPYKSGPGTAKFPLGKPIPYELIERIAALLAAQRG
ncbi:iron chaperone [Rhodococcus sp. NPDC127528]|uniref:iron chaperone n=1 Tax=unclassified Rhodococcus (in: high G+C Gram-positive bacteria) TaxID=192944 RepID=UPI00363C9BFA